MRNFSCFFYLDEKVESVNLEGNTILEKDLMDDKFGILDIKAKLNNEIICNIEMQIVNHKNIEKRMMYYWGKNYTSTIKSGEDYEKLKKTIVILVADFEFEKLKEIPKGHTEWNLREKEFSKYVLTNVCEIHILELPKLKKIGQEKDLSKWVKFILNPNEMEEKDMEGNESLKKAQEEWTEIQKDEYEQRMAFSRMLYEMDCKSIKDTEYDKGMEVGLKKGEQQGKKEAQIEIARKMLAKGKNIEEIIEITELAREEIERLKAQ